MLWFKVEIVGCLFEIFKQELNFFDSKKNYTGFLMKWMTIFQLSIYKPHNECA